ncbi:Ribosomal protein lysine methyltransferase [Exophiala xenobiotica]|nr:Ribosomal protein lysine methyltransferase [Exophiala xenobiotica]
MASQKLYDVLGPPIEDATEETFALFSQDIPSNNLGFMDSKRDVIEIEVSGHEYGLRQSPGLLTSNRKGGTTGAVLWKVTPLLATWLSSFPALLSRIEVLHADATVVELGCGSAGLVGLVLSRRVKRYVLTDQEYVMKYLRENILANMSTSNHHSKPTKRRGKSNPPVLEESLKTMPLDWETDSAQNLNSVIAPEESIDLLLLCDCVYNDYLVEPLVQMCADICQLRPSSPKATVVMVAQQLRSDSNFELFLDRLMQEFHVWRTPDESISTELRSTSGYVVHLATLRPSMAGKIN